MNVIIPLRKNAKIERVEQFHTELKKLEHDFSDVVEPSRLSYNG